MRLTLRRAPSLLSLRASFSQAESSSCGRGGDWNGATALHVAASVDTSGELVRTLVEAHRRAFEAKHGGPGAPARAQLYEWLKSTDARGRTALSLAEAGCGAESVLREATTDAASAEDFAVAVS